MKITVIGTGYVGLIAGLGFSNWGHNVICLDIDENKIQKLNDGICPIYEPGADLLLESNLKHKRIKFTVDKQTAIQHGEVIFIAVGTPQGENDEVDMSYVYAAAKDIAAYMDSYKLIVNKSTVPVGTTKRIMELIKNEMDSLDKTSEFDVASNPEFLREGFAVKDFENPDRVVIGVLSQRAELCLRGLYRVFERSNKPIIVTTPETAEMIKYATNAFLATKITFINEMANLCEKVGADVLEVARAMGRDGRISPKFLHPGPGFGGSCFPKDIKAITSIGRQHGAPLTVVESVITANQNQKLMTAQKIMKIFPDGCTIAILGLAFKPETDDVRESPALEIIRILHESGKFCCRLFDPHAMGQAKLALQDIQSERVVWCENTQHAVESSNAIAIITEWAEFQNLSTDYLKNTTDIKAIFDFRNIYNPQDIKNSGHKYYGTGVSSWEI